MGIKPTKGQPGARLTSWLICGWLAMGLAACGGDNPVQVAPPQASLPAQATAAPPFPANDLRPSPTVTDAPARSIAALPTQPPPPIFPTSTLRPTQAAFDFTATAGLPPLQLTPTAIPTGQLAFVQAGNLWLIDDTGGNRRQLTDSGDIGADATIVWNNVRDRAVYISRLGDLWLLDLQGKRTLIFSPAKAARPAPAAKLSPAVTVAAATPPPNATPKPTTAPRPPLTVTGPVWSPDSRYLAFTYYAEENGPLTGGEIWLAELVGDRANVAKVSEGFGPNWSGDGRTLAFLSRAADKQGPARPTPNLTPPGTSLLPPATTRPAQAVTSEAEGGDLLNAATPPGPSVTGQPLTPGSTRPVTSAATPVTGATTPLSTTQPLL